MTDLVTLTTIETVLLGFHNYWQILRLVTAHHNQPQCLTASFSITRATDELVLKRATDLST